ncbi:hypothetical protein [Pannonibacter phragmitetus]|uniref:hypothetical protein n=1 Tax=Pannonibacter phragmitetus TaxID=121719 RepID=UPI003D2F0189
MPEGTFTIRQLALRSIKPADISLKFAGEAQDLGTLINRPHSARSTRRRWAEEPLAVPENSM